MGLVEMDRQGRRRAFAGAGWGRASALMAGVAITVLLSAAATAQQPDGQLPAAARAGEHQQAAEDAAAGDTVLDEILVSSRTGETAIGSLSSSSHVDQQQLERRMASTPADVLFGVPGVAMQSDANRAAASVNIRGLQDFGRVAVIVDGARQNFQRSGHGTQSMFWVDPELLQSVDVIRGPVANTYGSGAIGGVVFYETRDATDFLRSGETWAASATGRYETNGNGWTTSATGAYRFNENFDALGNFVWRNFSDYKDGDGNEVAGTGFDILSGLLKTSIRPTDNSELKLGWIGATDSWSESEGLYDMGVQQNTFTARYNITDEDVSWLDLHVNLAYNGADLEQTYLTDITRFSSVTGLPITLPAGSQSTWDIGTSGIDLWNTSRFETGELAHELTYGGDWLQDDVTTQSPEGGDDVFTPSGDRRLGGAYIQEKLTWEWLEVVGALRYDSYSLKGDGIDVSDDRVSPRITLGVSPFSEGNLKGLQFYGTYAEGFRSPSLSETLISGLHPNGVVFPFLPNPYLQPETGTTVEFGLNYALDNLIEANDSLRLKAAYYHNDIDNYIGGVTLSPFDPTSGCPMVPGAIPICYQYQNFANAVIEGFELESVYAAGWGFVGLTTSIIQGDATSYEGEPANVLTIPSSQVTGQLGLLFFEDRLTVGGEVQYNAAPSGNPNADDYTLVNVFANYRPNEDFRVDFRVDNLFDVQYSNPLNASTVDELYEPGITLKLAATMRFGG
jgi:hemoglobin/transferrin/lactoferrin receptor protein